MIYLDLKKIERLMCRVEPNGMTQTDLAEKAGVSGTTISKLFNNPNADVKPKTLKKIANGLGVSDPMHIAIQR